jgi:hypothetical protein
VQSCMGEYVSRQNEEALSAWNLSVHFMFVCGVLSCSRESTVAPEIFTILGCFTHHKFVVICWTAGPLKVGLIRWSKTSLTTHPHSVTCQRCIYLSHLHHGRSLESHSCTCVCHTGMWGVAV